MIIVQRQSQNHKLTDSSFELHFSVLELVLLSPFPDYRRFSNDDV